jgi:hypothetical protein
MSTFPVPGALFFYILRGYREVSVSSAGLPVRDQDTISYFYFPKHMSFFGFREYPRTLLRPEVGNVPVISRVSLSPMGEWRIKRSMGWLFL